MNDPFVTISDIRAAREKHGGYCMEGVRTMAVQHGVNFDDLVRGRVRVSVLEATGDALVQQVARITRERSK